MGLIVLKEKKDFESFRGSGAVFFNPGIRMKVLRKKQPSPRFGFIIPKKTVPLVVGRNRIRRRIKDWVFKNLTRIQPFDYLFLPNRELLRKSSKEMEQILSGLFIKSKTWKPLVR